MKKSWLISMVVGAAVLSSVITVLISTKLDSSSQEGSNTGLFVQNNNVAQENTNTNTVAEQPLNANITVVNTNSTSQVPAKNSNTNTKTVKPATNTSTNTNTVANQNTNATAAPKYEVTTSIVDHNEASTVQVLVQGSGGGLTALISDPNKSTVNSKYISTSDMADGGETVWLAFQKYSKSNPAPGTYTVIVTDSSSRQVYKKDFTITGPKPKILSHVLTWKPYYTNYEVNTFSISITNEGDLTAYLKSADVKVNGTNLYVLGTSLTKYTLLAGETVTMNVGSSSSTAGSSFYDAGTYPMTISMVGQVNGTLSPIGTTYTTSISVP